MGWFYEVDITDDIFSSDYEKFKKDDKIIVQGKNSNKDYIKYFMDEGEAFRYQSVSELMPDIEGEVQDVYLIATTGDPNDKSWQAIYFIPKFFAGHWYVEEVKSDKGEYELRLCYTCNQMTNWSEGKCRKCTGKEGDS